MLSWRRYPEYQGPKQRSMPTQCSGQKVQSLKVLAMAASAVSIGKDVDFEFFKAMATQDSTPEFSGFNTKRFREAGVMLQPKTSSMYTPLIDEIPSDPTTVLTTLTEAIRLTGETGQESSSILYSILYYILLRHNSLVTVFLRKYSLAGIDTWHQPLM